jgi:hypothetical protein
MVLRVPKVPTVLVLRVLAVLTVPRHGGCLGSLSAVHL